MNKQTEAAVQSSAYDEIFVVIIELQVAGYGPNISFEINRYAKPAHHTLNERVLNFLEPYKL